jgi:hypothetical protein
LQVSLTILGCQPVGPDEGGGLINLMHEVECLDLDLKALGDRLVALTHPGVGGGACRKQQQQQQQQGMVNVNCAPG